MDLIYSLPHTYAQQHFLLRLVLVTLIYSFKFLVSPFDFVDIWLSWQLIFKYNRYQIGF